MNLQLQQYHHQQVQHEVLQASPVQLILMYYNKLVELLQRSLIHLNKDDLSKKGEAILRACDILSELKGILNKDQGGDIAVKLDGLYAFMIQELTRANFENNPKTISTILRLIEELREGWRGLEEMMRNKEKSVQGGVRG